MRSGAREQYQVVRPRDSVQVVFGRTKERHLRLLQDAAGGRGRRVRARGGLRESLRP